MLMLWGIYIWYALHQQRTVWNHQIESWNGARKKAILWVLYKLFGLYVWEKRVLWYSRIISRVSCLKWWTIQPKWHGFWIYQAQWQTMCCGFRRKHFTYLLNWVYKAFTDIEECTTKYVQFKWPPLKTDIKWNEIKIYTLEYRKTLVFHVECSTKQDTGLALLTFDEQKHNLHFVGLGMFPLNEITLHGILVRHRSECFHLNPQSECQYKEY